jgi:hypothetical protein
MRYSERLSKSRQNMLILRQTVVFPLRKILPADYTDFTPEITEDTENFFSLHLKVSAVKSYV